MAADARNADGRVPLPRERPDLVGHVEAVRTFAAAIASGRLHHAWLIGGPPGIGKATLAYRVARRLLARPDERSDDALGVGPDSRTARLVASAAHPNLVTLDLETANADVDRPPARTVPIKTVRRALALFGSTATDSGHRVCIVDSAEDLTPQAANALLKTIEEPPARSTVLIISHAPQRVLPTVRSRCRKLNLQALSVGEIRAIARSLDLGGNSVENDARDVVDAATERADGSVRRMLDLLDPKRLALLREARSLLDALPALSTGRVLALADKLSGRQGDADFPLVLDTVEHWIAERIRRDVELGARRLAPLAELCDKIADGARSVETFNLDRRPFVLSMFGDLAEAIREAAEARLAPSG